MFRGAQIIMLYTRGIHKKNHVHETGIAAAATDTDGRGWNWRIRSVLVLLRLLLCASQMNRMRESAETDARQIEIHITATQIKRFWLANEFNNILMDKNAIQLINCTYLILLIGASAASFHVTIAVWAIPSDRSASTMALKRTCWITYVISPGTFAAENKRTNQRKASISGIWIIRFAARTHIVRHNRRQQTHRQPSFPRTKRKGEKNWKKIPNDAMIYSYMAFEFFVRLRLFSLLRGMNPVGFFLFQFFTFKSAAERVNCSKCASISLAGCDNAFQWCARANKRTRFGSRAPHKNVVHYSKTDCTWKK